MYDILGSGGDWESGEGRGGGRGEGRGREVGQAEGEDAGEVVTEPPLPLDSPTQPSLLPHYMSLLPCYNFCIAT